MPAGVTDADLLRRVDIDGGISIVSPRTDARQVEGQILRQPPLERHVPRLNGSPIDVADLWRVDLDGVRQRHASGAGVGTSDDRQAVACY